MSQQIELENPDLKQQINFICQDNNYSDTSGSLWQFKRDESPINDAGNPVNVAIHNSKQLLMES